MIPRNIRREHVIKAAKWIDENGVPEERMSTKYLVAIGTGEYPPKLVISIANIFANGQEWSHEHFSGGKETNSYLEELGFEIIEFSSVEWTRGRWRQQSSSSE